MQSLLLGDVYGDRCLSCPPVGFVLEVWDVADLAIRAGALVPIDPLGPDRRRLVMVAVLLSPSWGNGLPQHPDHYSGLSSRVPTRIVLLYGSPGSAFLFRVVPACEGVPVGQGIVRPSRLCLDCHWRVFRIDNRIVPFREEFGGPGNSSR